MHQGLDESAVRVVAAVRGVLLRVRQNRALACAARGTLGALAIGALVAATRAWTWPSAEGSAPLAGLPRAGALLVVGALAALVVGALLAWRRSRPSELHAARAIDDHLGLDDVVASAWALRSDDAPAAVLARRRGARALDELDPVAASPRPSLRPSRRRVAAALAILFAGLALGTLDATVVTALIAPPTPTERAAADALEEAAAALVAEPRVERAAERSPRASETERRVAAHAKQIARAARRGDRSGALRALRRMEDARRQRASEARSAERLLDAMAAALGATPRAGRREERSGEAGRGERERAGASERGERPSGERQSGADAARAMSRLLRQRESGAEATARRRNEERRMLERLERARERAEAQAAREGTTNDALSEALQRAIDALSEGDREAAAAALDRLAAQLRRMEGELERGRATMARTRAVSAQAEALARALQRARMGQDGEPGEGASMAAGGEGEGEGEGGEGGEGAPGGEGRTLSAAIANRLAALGLARGPASTSGPGGSLRARGRALDALPTHGDAHARSQVNGEGAQAIAAVAGVGANGEPTTEYQDVYPSYGVRVEEALADERIPAARRRVVRRYFESIRPDAPRAPGAD